MYFFGTSWTHVYSTLSPPPTSVYATNPRISFVQGRETLVTAFLDIYNNWVGAQTVGNGSITYVAPGIDSTTTQPDDAFYGEQSYNNSTAGSQWARALSEGLHEIFYLHKVLNAQSVVNEHPAHGMIVTIKA